MNPPTADEAKEAVRNATDIVQFVGEKVRLRRVGTRWSGLCPFHAEKTPSFTVNPERQIWHCFGCGKGGDVFAFLMESDKVTFPEALAILADRAGIELPKGERGPGAAARDRLLQANALASDFFQASLRSDAGAAARAYLAGRGFKGPLSGVLDAFHVGWAPDQWEALATALGKLMPAKTLEDAGLTLRRGDGSHFDRFRNRIIFPVETAPGKTAGFGARAIAPEDQPKYLNSPETALFRKGSLLFGLPQARAAIRERKEVLVAEGYLDVLRLHAAGFTNAVATCGTALTIEHARALARFEAGVVLVYDGDTAGVRAADRGLDPLLSLGLAVRVLLLPAGEDPDSFLAKGSPAAFTQLLSDARDVPGFLAEATLGDAAEAPAGAKGANPTLEARVRRFVGLMQRVEDPIRRRLLVRRASEAFGLEESVLLEAVAKRPSGGSAPRGARTAPAPEEGKQAARAGAESAPEPAAATGAPGVRAEALDPAERELAARALTEEGALMAIAAAGGAACFATAELREILAPWIEAGQPPLGEDRDRLVAEHPLVRGILAVHPVEDAVPLEDQRRTARGLIERLEERRLRATIAALDRAIREAEQRRDDSLERLVAERRDLASKLHQRSQTPVS
ncbi:MAG TPA: DNA primase [Candidatus Eisenbacteria bacterium]|nr:DNA primase [Candidatus Eisenbacteria bacterium]